jgi:hypothetical protein
MVTEGAAVFVQIDRALSDAQREVERERAEASRLDAQLRELVASRGEALDELARHYLPDVTRPQIEQTFVEVRGDLLAILRDKEQRRQEIEDQLVAGREQARKVESELEAVTARLNEKVKQREDLEARVTDALKEDAEFHRLSKAVVEAEQALHRNEQRVEAIRAEAAEKLPAFERSPLFRYLYGRGYGTASYQSYGLIARLDHWVARLIDFPRARQGYEFLRRVPPLVEEEVARRRKPFDELMRQVEAIQRRYAEEAGLTKVLDEGQQLGAARDRLVAELEQARARVLQLDRTKSEWSRDQLAYYHKAIDKFKGFLDRAEQRLLEQKARQTPEPKDDNLVAQLAQVGQSMKALDRKVAEQLDRRGDAERLRDGLNRLAQRFREANYDSDRSYFPADLDTNDLIEQCRSGRISPDQIWDELHRSQRFRPHPVERIPPGWPPSRGVPASSIDFPEIINSPAARILVGALGQVVGAAMRESASRGVQRRVETWSMPSTPSAPPAPPPPAASGGGFTSGEGF